MVANAVQFGWKYNMVCGSKYANQYRQNEEVYVRLLPKIGRKSEKTESTFPRLHNHQQMLRNFIGPSGLLALH